MHLTNKMGRPIQQNSFSPSCIPLITPIECLEFSQLQRVIMEVLYLNKFDNLC